jgi:hypothetical protein
MCGLFRELKASRGREIFDPVSLFEFGEYEQEDFGGGECIAAGAMTARDRNREMTRDRFQPVI